MFRRRRDCKWVGCLLWLFTALLGLILVAQIPFVLLFVFDLEVKVPPAITRKASEALSDDGFRVSFSSVTLDKHGTLRFADPKLENDTGRRLLSADQMAVDLFLPSTLLGFPKVDRIEASGIKIWDATGPLGKTDPLATIPSFCVKSEGSLWTVLDFRAELDNLRLAAAGEIRLQDWKGLRWIESGETAGNLEPAIRRLSRFRAQLTRIREPFVRITLPQQSEGNELFRISATAARAELPGEVSLIEDLRFRADFRRVGEMILPGPLVLSARTLRKGTDLQVQRPHLTVVAPDHVVDHWRYDGTRVLLDAERIETAEGDLLHPSLALEVAPDLSLLAGGQVSLFGEPFHFNGRISRNFRTADLEASGLVSIKSLLNHPLIPPEARKPALDFGSGLFLRAETTIDFAEPIPDRIQFSAESTDPLLLEGFEALRAEARGTFHPREADLDVTRLSVDTPDFHLEGRYEHNLRTNQFRFLVDGDFHPSSIDGWMRPWWGIFWADFEVPGPASINLDLSGDWDYRDDRQLFGCFAFETISIKGTPIEKGHARMWSRPYFFELFDLEAYRPEGKLSGSLANLLNWENRETFAYLYDFRSTFHLDAISPFFGEAVADIVKQFDAPEPPEISIRGTVLPEEKNHGDPREKLVIRADTTDPLRYNGILLESLFLEATYSNDSVMVEPIRFGLGDGTGKASVRWSRRNPETGSFKLDYEGGDPAAFVDAIPQLSEATEERFSEKRESKKDRSRNLDFTLECTGDLSDPKSLLGEGSLDLRTPNLANVRLLGILSRISEELPLPLTLGSFEFRRATAEVLLNRGLIEFTDLHLYSPTSRVVASGSYKMKEEEIDFDAKMELMGEVKFPILAQIGMLLNPVGEVFEFRVYGKVDDMKWRLYLDPRSW